MKNRVLEYIKTYGSINTKQACIDLGCCDLQNYIRLLRRDMDIKDRWATGLNRYGEKTKWKEYYIEEK